MFVLHLLLFILRTNLNTVVGGVGAVAVLVWCGWLLVLLGWCWGWLVEGLVWSLLLYLRCMVLVVACDVGLRLVGPVVLACGLGADGCGYLAPGLRYLTIW